MVSFGERLREERSRLELNQSDFAALAGVTKKTQMLYESDERSPKADYLAALGNAGVDVLYVITGGRQGAIETSSVEGELDIDFMAEIADQLDRIIRQAGKKPPTGPDYVRMAAEVYNFLVQDGKRDAATTERLLKLVVNR